MSKKQDAVYPRTPEDVNRKYQAELKTLREDVERLKKEVAQLKGDEST